MPRAHAKSRGDRVQASQLAIGQLQRGWFHGLGEIQLRRSKHRVISAFRGGLPVDEPRIKVEQRLGSVRWRRGGVVASRPGIENQHGLRGVVSPDAREFCLFRKRGNGAAKTAQRPHDCIEQRHRHMREPRRATEQGE